MTAAHAATRRWRLLVCIQIASLVWTCGPRSAGGRERAWPAGPCDGPGGGPAADLVGPAAARGLADRAAAGRGAPGLRAVGERCATAAECHPVDLSAGAA